MGLMKQVQDLYAASHGLSLDEVVALPLPASPEIRREQWRAFWRQLGFDTDAPRGSSRLLELAMVQSTAGGSPRDMLQALVDVLGEGAAPVTPALEHFVHHLCAVARSGGERFAEAFDFLDGAPGDLGPGQAQTVLRFVRRRELYDEAAVTRLGVALRGASSSLRVADVFADDRAL